jgi:hypothetical protein
MARKPNHAYEKRQRDLAKKAKKEEKAARKRAAKDAKLGIGPDGLPLGDAPAEGDPDLGAAGPSDEAAAE